MLVSLFLCGLAIFPYGCWAIFDENHAKGDAYHTWLHFLASAGLFFAGLTYWVFAAAYLKTSLILSKLIKKMKLDVYSPRASGPVNATNDYYWERNAIEDSASAARGAMKSEKQMV